MGQFPISRKEESTFPAFSSYKEAYSFFSDKFGKDFILQTVEQVDGMNLYFHAVVSDWETYIKGQNELMKGKGISGDLSLAYILSYQPVQIFENGNFHIVH